MTEMIRIPAEGLPTTAMGNPTAPVVPETFIYYEVPANTAARKARRK